MDHTTLHTHQRKKGVNRKMSRSKSTIPSVEKSEEHYFCIYDIGELGKESGEMEEILLFNYPYHKESREIMCLVQIAQGISDIIEQSFESKPASVIELVSTKFVRKSIGDFGMVLTGEIIDSNQLLENHIDILWDAFEFYSGGFSSLVAAAEDRPHFRNLIHKYAKYLLPMIRDFHTSPLKFSPMPFIELSKEHQMVSSHFVMSWQLLDTIQNFEGLEDIILGGAILHKNKVVCTHLDAPTTKFIVNLLGIIDKDLYEVTDTYREYTSQIYLPESTYLSLIEQNDVIVGDQSPRKEVNLVLIKYRRTGVTVALIMEPTMEESHLKILKKVVLYNLELINSLGKVLKTVLLEEYENQYPFNFFSFSETTDMQIKTPNNFLSEEAEENFSLTINWAHDLFNQNKATKLILKNHTGSYFCAKQFGKEVYFHKDLNTPFAEIEETARETLMKTHNITLI